MSDTQQMLRDIHREMEYSRQITGMDAFDPRVMQAMREVPREEFVPENLRNQAYDNNPLSIGQGQTISQPFIVALMTDLLVPRPTDRILEVGTGSGYQSAILSVLVQQVYSIEIIPGLSEAAASRLKRLGYSNVECRIGDGHAGWLEAAPFDGIIVTAAPQVIPHALVEQLKPGGHLVIPVGKSGYYQQLLVVDKDQQGTISVRDLLAVAFVPMTSAG